MATITRNAHDGSQGKITIQITKITGNNLKILSTGAPTYHHPNNSRKIPDLLDFVVFSGILTQLLHIESSDEIK